LEKQRPFLEKRPLKFSKRAPFFERIFMRFRECNLILEKQLVRIRNNGLQQFATIIIIYNLWL